MELVGPAKADRNLQATNAMKAAYINQTGSADVIQFGDLEDPVAGPGQVLIRNHAVSVNPIDTYVRSGIVAFDLPEPYLLGCDAAGTAR